VVLQIFPSSATSLHSPCGGVVRLRVGDRGPARGAIFRLASAPLAASIPGALDKAAAAECGAATARPAGPAAAPGKAPGCG
jgi:hypothetical protein